MSSEKADFSRVEKAARNNAIWCDTVCHAHGIVGEFGDDLWLVRQLAPRFYPNAVTLSAGNPHTQLRRIEELMKNLPGKWAVKDSFNCLDLSELGFSILFGATWIWREVSPTPATFSDAATRWSIVDQADELVRWESAWKAANHDENQQRLFPATLIETIDVAFIAGYHAEKIVAGAIANRTGDVVGLSNVFTPNEDKLQWWAGCAAEANRQFPGLSLVGYEHGNALALARELGFEAVAPLRVWLRD